MEYSYEEGVGEQQLDEMKALRAQLEQESYAHHDGDLGIEAVVNGRGRLIDLSIPQRHVYGRNAEKLSMAISASVSAAKRKANQAARQRLFQVLGDSVPISQMIKPEDEAPEPSPQLQQAPAPEDDDLDDDFSEHSFLR